MEFQLRNLRRSYAVVSLESLSLTIELLERELAAESVMTTVAQRSQMVGQPE
jgi:hypothetical protein